MPQDVPFLTDRKIEDNAELLLGEFGNHPDRRPINSPPIPIDEIIELHLQLTFEIRDLQPLSNGGDVHGAIWFQSRRLGVDQSLDPNRFPAKLGRYHFTLAHEVGHWRLHRAEYLRRINQPSVLAQIEEKPDYICRTSERKVRVEWQADQFAAYLLMPRALVRQEWQKWRGDLDPVELSEIPDREERLTSELRRRGDTPDASHDDLILENYCRPLAQTFEVSAEAMCIRLESLDLLSRKQTPSLF